MSKDVRAGKAYVELGVKEKLEKGLQDASRKLKRFGASVARIGGGLASGGAAIITPLLMAAANAEEIGSKFDTVFGGQAEAVRAWSNEFASAVGRSRVQIAEFMSSSQDLFVPLGFDSASAEAMSKKITGLSIDLASFNNMQDADVMRDLQAALTGSGEVMKKYGVIVDEAGVKQELLNMGIKGGTNAQKVQARWNIIMRGTTAAQGDAIKTAGSFTNMTKALKAVISDLAVTMGQHLLPVATKVVTWLRDGANKVMEFAEANEGLAKRLMYVIAGATAVGGVLLGIGIAALIAGLAIPAILSGLAMMASVAGALFTPLALKISAVGYAAYFFRDSIMQWGRSFWNAILPIREAMSQLWNIVKITFGGISAALSAGDYGTAAAILWTGIESVFLAGAKYAVQAFWWLYDQAAGAIGKLANIIADQLSDAFASVTNTVNGGVSATAMLWASIRQAFASGVGMLKGLWSSLTTGLQNSWSAMAGGVVSIFRAAVSKIGQMFWDANAETFPILNVIWTGFSTFMKAVISDFRGVASKIGQMFWDANAKTFPILNVLWTGIVAFADAVSSSLVTTFGTVWDWFAGSLTSLYDGFFATFAGIVDLFDWLVGSIGSVGTSIAASFGAVWDWFAESLTSLYANFAATFGGIASAIMSGNIGLAAEILWASIQHAFAAGIGAVKGLWSSFTLGLQEVWSTMASGVVSIFRGVVAAIAGAMQSVMGKMAEVLNAVAEYDPTGVTAKIAAGLGVASDFVGIAEDELRARQKSAEEARNREQLARGQAHLAELKEINDKTAEAKAHRDELIEKANQAGAGVTLGTLATVSNANLEKLVVEARAATKIVDVDKLKDVESKQENGLDSGKRLASKTAGSFSALGAQLMGLGGSNAPAEETAKNTKQMTFYLKKLADKKEKRETLRLEYGQ